MKKFSYIFCVILIMVCFSCKRKGCTDPEAINYIYSIQEDDGSCVYNIQPNHKFYIPNVKENCAVLVGCSIRHFTKYTHMGEFHYWEFGVGAKFSTDNGQTFVNAGDVSFYLDYYLDKPVLLHLDADNVYHFHSSAGSYNSSGAGDFVFPFHWKGTGDVWPAFDDSSNVTYPTTGTVSYNTPSTASDLTFHFSNVAADSIAVFVLGQKGKIHQVIPGNTSSCTFSEYQMASLGMRQGYIKIIYMNTNKKIIDGRTYYFVLEKAYLKKVEIQ